MKNNKLKLLVLILTLRGLKSLKSDISEVKAESLKISTKLETIDSKISEKLKKHPKIKEEGFFCKLIVAGFIPIMIFWTYIFLLGFIRVENSTPIMEIMIIVGIVFITTLTMLIFLGKYLIKLEDYFKWWYDFFVILAAIILMYKAYCVLKVSEKTQNVEIVTLLLTNEGYIFGIPFVLLVIRLLVGFCSLKKKEDRSEVGK